MTGGSSVEVLIGAKLDSSFSRVFRDAGKEVSAFQRMMKEADATAKVFTSTVTHQVRPTSEMAKIFGGTLSTTTQGLIAASSDALNEFATKAVPAATLALKGLTDLLRNGFKGALKDSVRAPQLQKEHPELFDEEGQPKKGWLDDKNQYHPIKWRGGKSDSASETMRQGVREGTYSGLRDFFGGKDAPENEVDIKGNFGDLGGMTGVRRVLGAPNGPSDDDL